VGREEAGPQAPSCAGSPGGGSSGGRGGRYAFRKFCGINAARLARGFVCGATSQTSIRPECPPCRGSGRHPDRVALAPLLIQEATHLHSPEFDDGRNVASTVPLGSRAPSAAASVAADHSKGRGERRRAQQDEKVH
jgi:hypothetical protein